MRIPSKLQAVADDLAAGKRRWAKVKTLLGWFDNRGRGKHVVKNIRDVLHRVHLRTAPDFNSVASVHTYIEFKSVGKQPDAQEEDQPDLNASAEKDASTKSQQAEPEDHTPTDDQRLEATGPALCIGMLPAANRPDEVVTITRDHTVREAITLMMKYDYSQLPVAQNGRTKGNMISWRSIGRARTRNQDCEFVRDCMEGIRTVDQDAPLLDAVDRIVRNEVVVVLRHGGITGIVTTSDLSRQYHELAEPFLLLQEIEERIRTLVDDNFSADDIRDATRRDNDEQEIDAASNLTFGGYGRLFQSSERWEKTGLNIDRKMFVKLLDEVRMIRNEVMHFRADASDNLEGETRESTATA